MRLQLSSYVALQLQITYSLVYTCQIVFCIVVAKFRSTVCMVVKT